jgi:uncharacterized Zn finger protein
MAKGRWDRDDFFSRFPPKSTPRAAKGGIKAQSKQGGFGKSWWAKRWIGVLESFNLGARLGRGRSYARRGQVISINIDGGVVRARVQGSRRNPYKVTIKVKTLSDADSKKLGQALGSQALFAAKLLANEMPQDIETVFQASNLSLFPEKLGDLKTECSCPDWSNPCKHVAAVYYLLGEEFDRDPFLIFKLRGLDREKLVELIDTPEVALANDRRGVEVPDAEPNDSSEPQPEPISTEIAGFWHGDDLPGELSVNVQAPPVTAPLLKRLRSFPFWRSDRRFVEAFEPIYERASLQAMKVFVGESLKDEGSGTSPKPRRVKA